MEELKIKPSKKSDVEELFPCVLPFMVEQKDIPDEFESPRNPYVKFQTELFYGCLKDGDIIRAKEGIDLEDAIFQLDSILRSCEPKHEHKTSCVAYLSSLWLEINKRFF